MICRIDVAGKCKSAQSRKNTFLLCEVADSTLGGCFSNQLFRKHDNVQHEPEEDHEFAPHFAGG
jgi:hypothetical protein